MREGSSLILAGGKTRNSSSLPPSPGFFSAVDGLNLKNPRHVFCSQMTKSTVHAASLATCSPAILACEYLDHRDHIKHLDRL